MATPIETFFSVDVANMERATTFYVAAFGAAVVFASPQWTSLHLAGVRVALSLAPQHRGDRVGLHFVVRDLPGACADVERAGGRAAAPIEVAPGVITAEATDSEDNNFTLTGR
jgi:predicted enzyme related to lactoylglutathione lyase